MSPTQERIDRREFLRTTAALVGSTTLPACFSDSTGPSEPTAQVAAVCGTDLYDMTREVLQGIGGIGRVVHDGESVFIKPNMVTLPWANTTDRFRGGELTKPEIVTVVAEECLRAGAREVVIGDGSHLYTFDWEYATTLDGATNLEAEAARLSAAYNRPVRVACLESTSPRWVDVPTGAAVGVIAVSGLVADADRVISIPVAKTHSSAQLTLALKNFVGVTSLQRHAGWTGSSWDRGTTFDHNTPGAIAEIYLDVVDAVRPDLAIIDFSIGLEGDGPTLGHGGRTVDVRDRLGSWLLLASTDIVAADATAARVMSHDTSNIVQLQMAHALGLGEIRESEIELVGERLSELQMSWEPAELRLRDASGQREAAGHGARCPLAGRSA